jgi:hypothetical protein
MNKKPRTRIVNKTKDSVTLDFKGDIGKKTTTWEEFNEIYDIVDKIWAVPKDEAWERIQKQQKEFQKIVDKAVTFVILADITTDPGKKLGALAALGSCTDEVMKVLGCDKAEATRMLQMALSSYGPAYRELKQGKLPKPEKKEIKEDSKPKPASFSLGDVPGFENLLKDDDSEEKK